ncbi:MAG: RNA 3'-terminal phosphate cyclase [Candidatus Methylomirabilia bacterium]
MLTIDGSHGEGGGQILRTALSLAVALRRPVTVTRIRVRRPKPGLQPQHLTVVQALAAISGAQVEGDTLDSTELTFVPRTLHGGTYRFDVGAIKASAGSVSLLFQALLLPLVFAEAPSRLTLIGGTHVPWSPPVHYLTDAFLPALRRSGLQATLTLHRWGWYPRGGGEIQGRIAPSPELRGLRWEKRTAPEAISGISAVSRLPLSIAERQRQRALDRLTARGVVADIALVEDDSALGPGTVLSLAASGPSSLGGASALGRRGLRAEAVADEAVERFLPYLESEASVDDHLADQLVPFLVLAREPSVFTCPILSEHLRTVAWVVEQFLPARIELIEGRPAGVRITPAQAT